ncbi:hypothetical protein AFLA_010410 [Aspergillus flavus NRRL3357]|nr:hypothetical protein AFLA_010410 [Aspergillus flavus NRRL3357]
MPRARKTPPELYCSTCQTIFARKEHYQRHLRTHTKEKPFACTWCGQTFGRVDSLTRHHTTVHQNPGVEGLGGLVTSRRRVIQACTRCSQSKLRCDGDRPCRRCRDQQSVCHYGPSKRAPNFDVGDHVSAKPPKVPSGQVAPDGMNYERLYAAERSDPAQYPAPHGVTLPPSPERYSPHGEAEAMVTMNVTLAPDLSADHLIDFQSWFSVPADNDCWPDLTCYDQDLSVLDIVGPSVTEGSMQKSWDTQKRNASLPQPNIAEVYRRNQVPEIDKDAVEPRHYDPARTEDDAQLIFPDMTVIPREDIEAENLAHVEEVPAEVTSTVFELANDMQLKSNYPQFIELRIPPAPVLNAWVQLYFEHFHPMFPVLHKPTFSTSGSNPFLVLAVAAIGAHFSDIPGAQPCLRAMHELIRRYTSYTCEKLNLRSRELWMTQTILLNQLGLMYSGDRRALELAEIFQAVPVTLARRKRLFTNTLPQERLCRLDLPIAEKWHVSILDEQRRRAGFAIWLIDAAYDYNFDLCTTMKADELQNCFPQQDDRWDASNAQAWATFGEENASIQNITLGQVINDRTWRYAWSKTGTLGKQTILQYLANVVNGKDHVSPASPSFSPEQSHAALEALETLLEETGDQGYGHSWSDLKASAIHRVIILSALTLYHTPTPHIVPLAIKVIYGKMNDDSWTLTIDRWRSSSCQGRMGVLYASNLFETVRSARCIHFMTPVLLLNAVLVMWLYSIIHDRLRHGRGYQLEIPSVVLDLKSLNTPATKQWIANGSSCIKLPGISNLLSRQGRCKMLEESVVVMRSLRAWGISNIFPREQGLGRILLRQMPRSDHHKFKIKVSMIPVDSKPRKIFEGFSAEDINPWSPQRPIHADMLYIS